MLDLLAYINTELGKTCMFLLTLISISAWIVG